MQDELHTDDVEHDLIDKQDAGHAVYSSLFTGNKNKTGQKLGSARPASGHSMHGDLLDKVSGGNKNKTGKSLGQSHSHAEQHAFQNVGSTTLGTRPVHVPLKFKGNKNGNGSKLGHMHKIAEDTQHNLMLASRNYDQQVTHNPASIHFSGNKNGNGTKLGLQAVQHDTGENTIPMQTYTDALHLSDPTVTDAQQLPCKRTRQIPSQVYAARFQSSDHKNCLYQNDKKFGFIPLNDLMVYTGPEVIWGSVPDIVEAHAKIQRSGLPNFMHARIPLNTQLKVHCWKKYLHSYWDQQLVDLIQFGFPLDFDRRIPLQSTEVNHNSALKYSEHVSKYIQEELQYGAVLGPFKQFPFACHVSPFLTKDKPNSNRLNLSTLQLITLSTV